MQRINVIFGQGSLGDGLGFENIGGAGGVEDGVVEAPGNLLGGSGNGIN